MPRHRHGDHGWWGMDLRRALAWPLTKSTLLFYGLTFGGWGVGLIRKTPVRDYSLPSEDRGADREDLKRDD